MSAAPIELVIGAWVAGPSEDRYAEHDFASESNTRTLLSEYAPQRKRSRMVTFVFTGFILRWALIGFTAAWLIPAYGWRPVLVVGGTLSLALIPALLWSRKPPGCWPYEECRLRGSPPFSVGRPAVGSLTGVASQR